ncbi:hypothetical protein Tco_0671737 [Tanacetum coccineum]
MSHESCIQQFWTTAKAKTVNRGRQIQALVDKKKVIITEKGVRSDLMLDDAEGTECLPNDVIFEQPTLMGYENFTQKLTFYKAYISSQWKFLIHTILQCLGAKTTSWNKFSSTMASAIICLATNQKFNFSKYIFDNMMKNLEGGVKFLMYPRGKEKVLDLEEAKTTQATEIASLKQRVKQLEKSRKSRNYGLKRLRKVGSASRVESSNDVSLDAQEDASKQGRKIVDLDANAEVTLIDETQGKFDEEMLFDVQDDLQGEEVIAEKEVAEKEVSAADPVTTASEVVTTASATTTIDELTLDQTLIEIKAAKPKAVTTATTKITTVVANTRPKAKGIVFHDQKEQASAFTPTVSSS